MPRKRKEISNHTPLARFLDKLIETKGMTAKALAQQAGVAPSVLNGWRNGATPNDLAAIKKLANRYGVSLSQALLAEDDIVSVPTGWDSIEVLAGLCEISIRKFVPKSQKIKP
jgi:transcriptional regulator with XRE-family HTH domain